MAPGIDISTSSEAPIANPKHLDVEFDDNADTYEMKRTGRDSTGSRMFKEFMVKQNEKQDRLIEILQSDASGVNKDDPYSASRCISVLNGMIDGRMMADDSPLIILLWICIKMLSHGNCF
ncbi:myb/SANT-like domain-containing protein [Artemisia annua]|uniref:Myb/SANT-like domain-containing protein n=1 Tax=Artemisia annua TaxID=35608 RepID=A0A2U1LZS8_ARTAN|nr:myb/SANT-like domain-containing protein [Artemisia annua]